MVFQSSGGLLGGETVLEVQKSQDDESSEGEYQSGGIPQSADTPGDVQRMPASLRLQPSALCEEITPGLGQEPPNKNKDSHSRAHTGLQTVPVRLS